MATSPEEHEVNMADVMDVVSTEEPMVANSPADS